MALTRALRRVLHLGALATFVGLSGSEPVLDGALQAPASAKLVVTPLMGQCYSNGTTTFRANAPVKWQLFALDGSGVPYSVLEQTPTQLTVEAGHRGGRLLVLASATTCEAGSPCAEQLGSPTCAGVLSGETTLAQVGAGLCSQAFANASWSIVPWWKARDVATGSRRLALSLSPISPHVARAGCGHNRDAHLSGGAVRAGGGGTPQGCEAGQRGVAGDRRRLVRSSGGGEQQARNGFWQPVRATLPGSRVVAEAGAVYLCVMHFY